MKPKNTEYIPQKEMSNKEMQKMQLKVACQAIFKDYFNFEINDSYKIVGVDQAFTQDKSVSCAVLIKNNEINEVVSATDNTPIPYIPGLLTFREGRAIIKALQKLKLNLIY